MESRRKENKGKSQLLVGSLLIMISISLFSIRWMNKYYEERKNEDDLERFYQIQEEIVIEESKPEEVKPLEKPKQEVKKEQRENYIAVLKIPKINLEKGLYKKESINNNVNKNIQILKESNYPNEENGNFILAGHSGSGRTAYFRNLDKVGVDDEIEIIYQGLSYKYKIINRYEIPKTGTAHIKRNGNKKSITLITCKGNTDKQLVFIGEQF